MLCPRCHIENREGRRFCADCGAALALACAACGFTNEAGEKFCGGCGTRLLAAPMVAPPKFGSPQSYTPKHLAEKILTSKAALEGERKHATVLFADLKGSMELLADRDPEEARKILDPVLERMMEAVHRYEGTVNQVMGDGIMALFGAPLAHEDHAVRACYAALRMQESVKKYAEEVRRSHAAVVKIRVGLNSGEVVVRAIGSDLHMDYTAVGQTTHLAARMEQLADPGAIVITPETLALVEGYVEVKSLGPVPVKGLTAPIEIYEVTSAGAARTRLQASARRGLTRFVGRDAELEQLRRAQQLAGDGRGQVAAVVGEAGVGKSRLVYELTHSHRLQGWLTIESASVSYGKATSWLPVIELLKGYFKIQDRDDHREIREKVTGKLLTLDESLKPTLPALLALLDVPIEDAAWQSLDPAQRRQQTLDGVKRLLLREAREQPVLLIFEDLHWIDSETQALLDGLIESLGSARLLLLVNYRPEYQHAWGSKTAYSQMRLDALPAESAGELLVALLGDDPTLVPLKQLLAKRGNPFFLEETVRTLVETRALTGERGRYRLTQPIQAIQVPATVQAMLAARIDRLTLEDKRLLQVASVIGKDVPLALLQAIADLSDEALRSGLDRLQAAEFVYETGLYPDIEYSFKHALTHDVTAGGLLQERRRDLHARIVAAIETLATGRLAEQTERLAHHAFRGEQWDKAVVYLRQAGLRSIARAAYREATGHLEQALEALRHLPESRERFELAIDVRFELRTALFPLGEAERMLSHLREAEVLAAALGDERRRGRVLNYMIIQSLVNRDYDYDDALRYGRQALEIARTLGDISIEAPANNYLGLAHVNRGEFVEASDYLQRNIYLLTGDLLHERFGQANIVSVTSRSFLALALIELGRFAEAITHAEESARIAEDAGQRYPLAFAWAQLGQVHAALGDFPRAVVVLDRSLELSRSSQLTPLIRSTIASLAYAMSLGGRSAEALPLLDEAGSGRAASWILPEQQLVRLGAANLIAGRMEEATRLAQQALEACRRHRARASEAHALHLLGQIAMRRDPPDLEEAESRYRQALAVAEEFKLGPMVAHCHFGLGNLARLTCNREQAREHLDSATTMYRAMDMRYWLEQSELEQTRE